MSVAACPRCEGQVTVPPSAALASRAKCPLCEAEYSLSEVYDRLPPMLILLDVPVAAAVAASAAAHGTASQGADAFEGLFSPSEANGEGDLALAPIEDMDIDFADSAGDAAVAAAATTSKGPIRPRRKPKSMAKEMVKIALGGALGLSIGWYIALWILGRPVFGSSAEKSVVEKMPDWAKPASLRATKPAEAGDSGSATKGTDNANKQMPEGSGRTIGASDAATTEKNPYRTPFVEENFSDDDVETDPTTTPKTRASGATDSPIAPTTPEGDPVVEATNPPSGIEVEEPSLELPAPGEQPPVEQPPVEQPPAEAEPTPPTEKTPAPATNVPTAKAGLRIESPADAADVAKSLEAAKATTAVLSPDDESAKMAFTREKYAAYTTLCEAALSVVQGGDNAENKTAASELATGLAANDADAAVLGQLANAWLSKERVNDGIVLVGKIKGADTQGDLTKIVVELPALDGKSSKASLKAVTVTVICPVETSLQAGDEIAVVGKVVEKAKDDIAGYQGENGRAIWAATVGKRVK